MTIEERLVYCDERFAVVNKLPGEVCSSEEGKINASSYLPAVFKDLIEKKNGKKSSIIECVNRIDRPVSGLVLLALTRESEKILRCIMNDKKNVHKSYWAIVEGVYEKTDDEIVMNDYMYFNPSKQKSYICEKEHRKSKYAELRYKIKGAGERYSYFEVQLVTGRTHQIRTQLASRGFHIRGDVKYGARRSDTLPGIRLHAARLMFSYPHDKWYSFMAPVTAADTLWNDAEAILEENDAVDVLTNDRRIM